jgi:subtilisin family serine protease
MGTIVIRRAKGPGLDAQIGAMEFSATRGDERDAAAAAEISVEDLSQGDKDELEASPEFVTADAMPISLIEPLDFDEPLGAAGIVEGAGGRSTWGVVATGADRSQFNGSGVPVAVLDTGIDAAHPAFAGVNIVQKNFTKEPDGDLQGHGTHCAGTIFGRPIGGIRIGVAPGITNVFIGKVIPGGSDDLVRALTWAFENGARVASMSLGFDFGKMIARLRDGSGIPEPAAISMALRIFRANITTLDLVINQFRARALDGGGMLVVAATGNESRRSLVAPQQPYTVAASSPSASMGIVSVGAVRKTDKGLAVADFSNTNPQVCAPGVGVLSAAAGTKDMTEMNGTSMACPHVAGLAALYWQQAMQDGGSSAEAVAARVVGQAGAAGLLAGSKRIDVGNGLAHAP